MSCEVDKNQVSRICPQLRECADEWRDKGSWECLESIFLFFLDLRAQIIRENSPPLHTYISIHFLRPKSLYPPPFFFLSSTHSTLPPGTPATSITQSKISSLLSPCTTTSSPPEGVLVTLLPVANFFPHSLATFFKSMPWASRPLTAVTYFRLLRSTRLIRTFAAFLASVSFASRASARASFFSVSFCARFWASTERVESEAVMAAVPWRQAVGSGFFGIF